VDPSAAAPYGTEAVAAQLVALYEEIVREGSRAA
jgi:hypothetical protein